MESDKSLIAIKLFCNAEKTVTHNNLHLLIRNFRWTDWAGFTQPRTSCKSSL